MCHKWISFLVGSRLLQSGIFLFIGNPQKPCSPQAVIMDEWRKVNTAFAFWQGLQKEGRAVVTLPSGYARVAMLPFRTDGIPLHAAIALLAGWPDLCEAWSQSHRFLLCLFPYARVPRWLPGLA